MKLWYISIGPDIDRTPDHDRYRFELNTRFLSNHLSRAIRKRRFTTDGTFNQIHVALIEENPELPKVVGFSALRVHVLYDPADYEAIRGSKDCSYYLRLFEQGFRAAAASKLVPLEILLEELERFRQNGCKNEWRHKRKLFRDQDVSVTLDCYFTTNEFRLVARIERISTKEVLCEGVVVETVPDEIFFYRLFKDIFIRGDRIIVTDHFDSERYLIDLDQALSGRLVVEDRTILIDAEIRELLG